MEYITQDNTKYITENTFTRKQIKLELIDYYLDEKRMVEGYGEKIMPFWEWTTTDKFYTGIKVIKIGLNKYKIKKI